MFPRVSIIQVIEHVFFVHHLNVVLVLAFVRLIGLLREAVEAVNAAPELSHDVIGCF